MAQWENDMFERPSLVTRIAVGKGLGLAVGLVGFFSLPMFMPEADFLLRWGILLWYTTLGAVIGVFGVFNWHPILKLPLPWWVRAPFVGAWMNFVLTFFAYDAMQAVMTSMFGVDGILQSPFWFAFEGAVVGLVIGFAATKIGGEGVETVGR
jgi:hypothetical protein